MYCGKCKGRARPGVWEHRRGFLTAFRVWEVRGSWGEERRGVLRGGEGWLECSLEVKHSVVYPKSVQGSV